MREEVSKEDFEGELVDLVPGRKKFVIFSMEIQKNLCIAYILFQKMTIFVPYSF